ASSPWPTPTSRPPARRLPARGAKNPKFPSIGLDAAILAPISFVRRGESLHFSRPRVPDAAVWAVPRVTGLRGRQQRGTALNLFQRYVLTRLFCLSGGRDSSLVGGLDGSTLRSEYSLLFPNRPSITYEKALNDLTNLTKGNNSLLGALPMV